MEHTTVMWQSLSLVSITSLSQAGGVYEDHPLCYKYASLENLIIQMVYSYR